MGTEELLDHLGAIVIAAFFERLVAQILENAFGIDIVAGLIGVLGDDVIGVGIVVDDGLHVVGDFGAFGRIAAYINIIGP